MNYYNKISEYINGEERNKAVLYALELLSKKEITIVSLYQDALSVILHHIDCDLEPEECIWKEHVKSAIVRTIIDASFPFVIEESTKVKKVNKKILVVCPSEEYHEIGAKMAYNFFLMHGYDAIFIGANTPTAEIISAVKYTNPDYLAISVTDKYNVIKARQVVSSVKEIKEELKILIGGIAFSDESVRNQINHDFYLTDYESIGKMGDI
jgi:methanogenic corrinoid protein MtbC1